jgi:SNF2 family DNA or RNA helicase
MADFQIPIASIWALPQNQQDMKITLYPHQIDLVKWMLHQETEPLLLPLKNDGRQNISGGLVADIMGLGKTKAAVTCLTINPLSRTLIICPKSVFYQWCRELISQCHVVYSMHPDYALLVQVGLDGRIIIAKNRVMHRDLPDCFVGVTTFGMVRPFPEPEHKIETASKVLSVISDQQFENLIPYNQITWNRIVIDEAHSLRNGFSLSSDKAAILRKKTLKYYRILRLKTSVSAPKWALTGTPLQNRISDVASIFLWIGIPVTKMTQNDKLQEYIGLKMFRRDSSNLHPITKNLIKYPTEKYEETRITVQYSTKKESDFYLAAAGELGDRITAVLEAGYAKLTSEDNILVLLNMLRFLSAHPSMYIDIHNKRYETAMPKWIGPLSKYDMIQHQLTNYYNEDESCIIFVHFYEEARQIADRADKIGYQNIEFMNGSVSMEDRDWIVQSSKQRIISGEAVLIVANVIACGEGINLQHFHNIIIATPDWNPAAEEQAIGRVDRIGQTQKVKVTRYYHEAIEKMRGTLNIDEYMQDKQNFKIQLAINIIDKTPNAAWSYPVTLIPKMFTNGVDIPSTLFPLCPTIVPTPVENIPATARDNIRQRMKQAKQARKEANVITYPILPVVTPTLVRPIVPVVTPTLVRPIVTPVTRNLVRPIVPVVRPVTGIRTKFGVSQKAPTVRIVNGTITYV